MKKTKNNAALKIVLTEEQKFLIKREAAKAGQSSSSWILKHLNLNEKEKTAENVGE